jgi:hypothetical protein
MRTPLACLSVCLSVSLVSLLAGCAGSAPQWEKSGAGETAIADDLQRCRVEVSRSPSASVFATPAPGSGTPMLDRGQERDSQDERRVRDCMQGKGYSLKR